MLLSIPASRIVSNISTIAGIFLSVLLFIMFYDINHRHFGIFYIFSCDVPDILYDIRVLTPIGFPYKGFSSSDYFPLLPWIFIYLCGMLLYQIIENRQSVKKKLAYEIPFLSFLGRHSLLIYMLHQPVCMAVAKILQ